MKKVFLFICLVLCTVCSFGTVMKAKSGLVSFSKNSLQGDSVKITIPNVFTPNNDYKNDTWSMIITNGIEIFDLQTTIYNRWGKKVFESTNTNQHWDGNNFYDGNECTAGTYLYIVSYTDGNTQETKTLKGFIEIVR